MEQKVVVEGVVTAPGTLLDASGRRIVIQDASGAIEVLLPAGTSAPRVGTKLRVEGIVGRAYGAPRLRASAIGAIGSASPAEPRALRASPGEGDEWSLVVVTGRIESLRKLGERWRAELLVGSTPVVIVGQSGSGIVIGDLVEGRMARVTGIVRRPYPNASDQRFSITPRSPADLRLFGSSDPASGSSQRGASDPGPTKGDMPAGRGTSTRPRNADLVKLAAFTGQTVRVGGLVVELAGGGVWLDDGTTTGFVAFRGQAQDLGALLELDDAVNVTGRVESAPEGFIVVVEDPAGVVLAADPGTTDPGSPDGAIDPSSSGQSVRGVSEPLTPQQSGATTLDGLPDVAAGLAGLATLLLVSLVSLGLAMLRRLRMRRLLAARVMARMAPLGSPPDDQLGSRSAERAPSTIR
jgi:hypothetical protein